MPRPNKLPSRLRAGTIVGRVLRRCDRGQPQNRSQKGCGNIQQARDLNHRTELWIELESAPRLHVDEHRRFEIAEALRDGNALGRGHGYSQVEPLRAALHLIHHVNTKPAYIGIGEHL
jgi:hypothetical protein